MGKKNIWLILFFYVSYYIKIYFFFLIYVFICILFICILYVVILKIKENCMLIFLMNGNIMFGNDK